MSKRRKTIAFIATKKNLDETERELYEMDLVLEVTRLKRSFADLGLLTVAACTPDIVDVRFVDEYCEDIDYDMDVDLVALSAKTSCATRAYQTADRFRAKGVPVVLGGIHALLRPDEALEHADCVVTGEAELLWPTVVQDFVDGKMAERYDADGFPDMDRIPVPAWQPAPTEQYFFQQLQTTRGCPFRCRFCSVPDISGQDFRFKPVHRVIEEIRRLPRGGGIAGPNRPLYIVDDNFISRTRYTRELLEALVPLHQRGEIPPWSAETTLNVCTDPGLLDLFAKAGCETLIIGFESIEEASLDLMKKGVNYSLTFQDAVERIHRLGMTIVGNFIVGFDTDTVATFKATRDFVQQTGLLYPFFSILTPMPGTALFDEFEAEGRLDHQDWHLYDTRHTVMTPKNLTQEELLDGYIWLYEQTYDNVNLLDRLERNWMWAQRRRPRLAKAFIGASLGAKMWSGDSELRRLYRKGIGMMFNRKLNGQPGQLLITLDSTDFARFMRRYRSANYRKNAARFENPTSGHLGGAQWDDKRAVRQSARLSAK